MEIPIYSNILWEIYGKSMDFHRFPQLFPKKGAPGEVWALEKTSSRDAEVAPVALPGKPMGKRREKRREKMEKNLIYHGKKQDAAHEPECSHVEHYCETSYLNSLHFSPVTVPVHCRL
jgi:hypothetical protein